MIPLKNYGVECMSMGFLVDPQQAVVWRGPMVMGAIEKMAFGTLWNSLDVLLVDLPPGTGDIHLSIAQNLNNITGAIIVSTPQKVALADAKKAVKMFNLVNIPILGLVENMSAFCCPKCNETTYVFGDTHELLENVPTLGKVPLEVEIMKNADEGTPIIITHPESNATMTYQSICDRIVSVLQ